MMNGHSSLHENYKVISCPEVVSQGETGILETRQYMIEDLKGEKTDYQADFWISKARDNSDRVNASWMPQEYFGKGFSSFDWSRYPMPTAPSQELANEFVEQYAEMFVPQHRGLYIYSAAKGSGKTLLACCLANEIARKHGCNIKFTSEAEYLEQIKNDNYKTGCRECNLLVLDDFGVAKQEKEWIVNALYGLINCRNSEMRTTIITSNVPLNTKDIEDRIMSRIRSMCLELRLPEYSVRDALTEASNQRFREQLRANRQRRSAERA